MSKMPKTPPDQLSSGHPRPEEGHETRHDRETELEQGSEANLKEEGRFGNMEQNVTYRRRS
ncbi:MAG: hypothetical protein LCH57_04915 [Proteobacteria bacterium]|uniref:hypothetical protein n=1 Tax=Brevundimonas sp. TaxID=1871086 RepID=UPI000DB17DBA|nr:hypothetical protein [Brevundimonas sp.]MCA0367389.1 hypothetical protein [Pseudomonadota bacterium]PZU75749.1 MAG: hypothetical protein DI531_03765 [Brevundimonas sp.]